jgi:hypothetical protein
LLGLPFCYAQIADNKRAGLATEAAGRISNLTKSIEGLLAPTATEEKLREECRVDCSRADVQLQSIWATRMAAMDAVISRIHGEVDSYIARAMDPKSLDRAAVERDLTRILGSASWEPPSVFVLNVRDVRSLIVTYTLSNGQMMGPGTTSVTLRAYRAKPSGLELASSTGADMAGYVGLSVTQLPSPVPERVWFLAKGQMSGANGPNIRMRVYAYDGTNFRTVWMPENAWGSYSIQLTEHGFTVDGPYYREDRERHDAYFLASDGVYRGQR